MTSQVETRLVGCTATIFHQQPDQLIIKEGQQIPGYLGHCPLLRYDFGKTYGQGTHEAYMTRQGLPLDFHRPDVTRGREDSRLLSRSRTSVGLSELRSGGSSRLPERGPGAPSKNPIERNEVIMTRKGYERRGLPQSNGSNKYTENMVPGYTGYIPRYPFQFGNCYKEECDICLDEHFNNLDRLRARKHDHLLRTSQSAGTLHSLREDPIVRDGLNEYSGLTHPGSALTPRLGVYNPPVLEKNCELPIVGYRGFIPRVGTTDVGLGKSYTEQTKNGLDEFYEKKLAREAKLGLKHHQQGFKSERNIIRSSTMLDGAAKWSSNCRASEREGRERMEGRERGTAELRGNDSNIYRATSTVCDRSSHNATVNGISSTENIKTKKSVSFVV